MQLYSIVYGSAVPDRDCGDIGIVNTSNSQPRSLGLANMFYGACALVFGAAT